MLSARMRYLITMALDAPIAMVGKLQVSVPDMAPTAGSVQVGAATGVPPIDADKLP